MRKLQAALVVGAVLMAGCLWRGRGAEAPLPKDVVVYVARQVRTLDEAAPMAQAFAVSRGRYVAVGTREEVLRAVGGAAKVVELGEVTVIPGLEDAHAHLLNLGKALGTIDLSRTGSLAEALEQVKTAPASSFQGDWLVGRGWDQNDWPELGGKFPDRQTLDVLWPDKPVVLTRVDGHAYWANSEALRRAKVTAQTEDPSGGRILRDAQGAPTGVLVDNAMDLLNAALPEPGDADRKRWLTAAMGRCAQLGLTTLHDAGMDLATFTLLQQWDALDALPLRIYAMVDGHSRDAATLLDRGPFEGRKLALQAVKFWADGALGSRGAALHAPYSDEPGHTGLLLLEPAELESRVRAFMAGGFQVAIHAIGDRANSLAIELLARVSAETDTRRLRHRVEHLQIVRLEDLPRMKEAGLIASMQPTHATSDMPWAEARVGPSRLAGAYAWRRVLEAGIPLAFGSDFPVERPDPMHGLYAARTRQDAHGQPPGGWLPDQRLSGQEALHAFTVGSAYAARAEARRGKIAPGFDADFVALPVDPVDGPPREVRTQAVRLTVVAGREVYRPR